MVWAALRARAPQAYPMTCYRADVLLFDRKRHILPGLWLVYQSEVAGTHYFHRFSTSCELLACCLQAKQAGGPKSQQPGAMDED